ncbi:hypothetical protein FOZ62_021264 [Perkinsus olseni]|uniref:PARG catalytic Macro domain-containing protein n=1 Tax=Perkinsus olseni TaxID=32597 RepID=A0A7J6P0T5_PEROL|nr:hypothetical protein FOZ62_021264 [Perkinsus olseni]
MESRATSVVLPTEAQWLRVAANIETLMRHMSCAKEQRDIFAHLANFVSANESIFRPPTSYFKAINDTAGRVKIRKEYIKICRGAPTAPANLTGASKLCEVKICDTGGIEDAHGLLQADFANRFIGGGVLEGGNVQEEIRFSICPELVVSMLLCEVMNDHEAIRIEGATRFSSYSGYGGSFKWTGEFDDPTPLSSNCIRDVSLFCVDALPHPGVRQYSKELIEREIRKFYCGVYKYPSMDGEDSLKRVATGNWGCGVFGGDPQLKFVWAAASLAKRPIIHYYRYGERKLAGLDEFIVAVKESEVTLERILEIMQRLSPSSGVFTQILASL